MAPIRPRCRGGNRSAAAVLLNRKICEAADSHGVEGVLSLCDRSSASLVNLSTALHRVAVLSARPCDDFDDRKHGVSLPKDRKSSTILPDDRVVRLQKRVQQQLLELKKGKELLPFARCLSTVAWASVKLDIADEGMLLTICNLSVDCMQAFKPIELANLLWSITEARLEYPPLFQRAVDQVVKTMNQYTVRSLSMVAWAFAIQKIQKSSLHTEMMADMAAAFVRCYSETTEYVAPVVVVNMAWALATLGFGRGGGQGAVLAQLAACAHEMVDKFKHDELSITLWAFAKLEVFPNDLFAAAALRLRSVGMKQRLQSQGLANVFWAFAKYSQACLQCAVRAPELAVQVFVDLVPVYRRLERELEPLELSSIIWATSILAPYCPKQDVPALVMISAACGPTAHSNVVSRMSLAGAVSMLGAYVRFFQDSGVQTPNTVSTLMIRLLHQCRTLGLMLRSGSDVLAYQELAAPTNYSWNCQDLKREVDPSKEKSPMREANYHGVDIFEKQTTENADHKRQDLDAELFVNPRAFAHCTAEPNPPSPSSDDEDFEPAFVLGELAAAHDLVASADSSPMFITSSNFAVHAWKSRPNLSVTVNGMQDFHLCVIPELSRCGADVGDIEIAFRASSPCPNILVEALAIVQGHTELLVQKDVVDQGRSKVLMLRVKPHDGDWTLHLSLTSRVSRLACLALPFIGRIPRLSFEASEGMAGLAAKAQPPSVCPSFTPPALSVCSRSTCEGSSDSSECDTPPPFVHRVRASV